MHAGLVPVRRPDGAKSRLAALGAGARARIAAGLGALADEAPGLNAALAAALTRLDRAGAASATILPGDVPLATPDDVDAIVDAGGRAPVVVVPSRDGGTNALHLRPPGALEIGRASCRERV